MYLWMSSSMNLVVNSNVIYLSQVSIAMSKQCSAELYLTLPYRPWTSKCLLGRNVFLSDTTKIHIFYILNNLNQLNLKRKKNSNNLPIIFNSTFYIVQQKDAVWPTDLIYFFLSSRCDTIYCIFPIVNNFRYFKVRNFFNQTPLQFEGVCSFFVFLFRNTINPKANHTVPTHPRAAGFVLFRQCCYSLLKEFLVWFQYSDFTIFFVFHLLQISFNVYFNIFKFVVISTQWVLCFIKSVVKLCVSDHFRVNIFYLPVLNIINNV